MKRILFVTDSLFPLGPAQQIEVLARELTERSFQVSVAVIRAPEPPEWSSGLSLEVFPLGHPVTQPDPVHGRPIPSPPMDLEHSISRADLRAIGQLRRLIQHQRPDIVHAWGGRSGLLTRVAAQLARFNRSSGPKLFSTEHFLPAKKRVIRQAYENWIGPPLEATLVPHESAKKHLVEQAFEGRIEIVPNRIPCDATEPTAAKTQQARQELRSKLKLPPHAKIAGTVAPWIAKTRLKDLIWASDLLACVRDDFHFVVLGQGVQESRLRRFTSLTEAQQHIHFVGEPADAQSYIPGLDFYWHSHLLDPLPMQLMNAMALAIPVISVLGPGTEELIRHQETGFAVNFGARDEFARWTKFLIEQAGPAKQLAEQGQQHVRKLFAQRSLADDYLAIWNSSAS